MRDAQFALGHASIATTQRYVGFTEVKRLRELMETNRIRIEHGGGSSRGLGVSPNTGKGVPPFGCVGDSAATSFVQRTPEGSILVRRFYDEARNSSADSWA